MARYSIFTEFGHKRADFDYISGYLRGLDVKVLDTKDNSVVVEYHGNIREFRKLADWVLKDARNETTHIYISSN